MIGSFFYHPTRAEIDLEALAFNINQVRSLVGQEKTILAVVKANAYGHGVIGIVRELDVLGVDFFGVAFLEEGIQLRKSGIKKPILILGGIFPSQIKQVFSFSLTPVIYDLHLARSLEAEGKRQKKKVPVHIKIDTGMNRLGVPYDQAEKFFAYFRTFDYLEIEGVLSHFSSAHQRDLPSRDFTNSQVEKFNKVLKKIRNLNFDPPFIHMANSSAIIAGIIPELNMVRAGLMLYGAYPSEDLKLAVSLKPVMTLKTKVIQIRSLPAHSPISYSRTFYTKRKSLIATLAVGYGDGYPRCLSNQGKVLIRGRTASIVGLICMDLTLVNITDIPEAKVGDEVVLFGRQGEGCISVEDVAQWADTVPYEVLCGISSRVPRIYKRRGNLTVD